MWLITFLGKYDEYEIKNDGISYLDDEFLNTQTTVFKNLSDDANKLMQDLWIDVKSAN